MSTNLSTATNVAASQLPPAIEFKPGYNLMEFRAEFTEPQSFATSLSKKYKFSGSVDCQFLHCIAKDTEEAQIMIEDYYKSLGIQCKEIELPFPVTTKNSDIKYLNNPQNILGFQDALVKARS